MTPTAAAPDIPTATPPTGTSSASRRPTASAALAAAPPRRIGRTHFPRPPRKSPPAMPLISANALFRYPIETRSPSPYSEKRPASGVPTRNPQSEKTFCKPSVFKRSQAYQSHYWAGWSFRFGASLVFGACELGAFITPPRFFQNPHLRAQFVVQNHQTGGVSVLASRPCFSLPNKKNPPQPSERKRAQADGSERNPILAPFGVRLVVTSRFFNNPQIRANIR